MQGNTDYCNGYFFKATSKATSTSTDTKASPDELKLFLWFYVFEDDLMHGAVYRAPTSGSNFVSGASPRALIQTDPTIEEWST